MNPKKSTWALGCPFFAPCNFMYVEKSKAKKPNSPLKGSRHLPQSPLGGLPSLHGGKNREILSLQTHVSPHHRAETWTEDAIALATPLAVSHLLQKINYQNRRFRQRRSDSILGNFYHDSLRAKIFKTLITSLFEAIWVSN